MFSACLLFMGGLLIGIPVWAPGAPVIGMAHTLGLLEAVFMFTFVALRPQLPLQRVQRLVVLWTDRGDLLLQLCGRVRDGPDRRRRGHVSPPLGRVAG